MSSRLSTGILIGLWILAAPVASAQDYGPSFAQPWIPLFNGVDLTGWKTDPKQPGAWKVVGGAIVGSGKATSHLFADRGDFDGFHLRVEAKISPGGNGGVYFCGEERLSPKGFPTGYRAQISTANGEEEQRTASLFGLAPVRENWIEPNQWFTLEITKDGRFIDIKVNGKTAAHFKDENNTYKKGHFALEQLAGATVAFRRIEVLEGDSERGSGVASAMALRQDFPASSKTIPEPFAPSPGVSRYSTRRQSE